MQELLLAVVAALLGILVGAVINALADDLPHRRPPSPPHYPNGVPRPPAAWIGVLAFLLGKRAGHSIRLSEEEEKALSLEEITHLELDTALSWRHPLTELFTGGLFAFVVLYDPPRIPIVCAFLSILILITIIDLEHRLVLFIVVIPSLGITLLLNALFPENIPDSGPRPFVEYVYGGLLGGGIFFLMFLGGQLFANVVSAMRNQGLSEVAFGFGDVMLATLCGAMIGWRSMFFAMVITVFTGAGGALLYILWRLIRQKRYTMYTPLPYGPYIAIGTAVMMIFIENIRDRL